MNNKILVLISALVVASSAFARSVMRYSSYDLFSSPTQVVNPSCHTKTIMNIDHFNHTIALYEVVGGFCEIFIAPNHRIYQSGPGRSNGQGSVLVGERILEDGSKDVITVRDVRNAVVGSYDFDVSVTEEFAAGGEITRYTLLASKKLPGEISCFGHAANSDKVVELSSRTVNGNDFLDVQFSRSAGPMLPAFIPVGDKQSYVVDSVIENGDATLVKALSMDGVMFAGGGREVLDLVLSSSDDRTSKLTFTLKNVEIGVRSESFQVGCQVVR